MIIIIMSIIMIIIISSFDYPGKKNIVLANMCPTICTFGNGCNFSTREFTLNRFHLCSNSSVP